MGAVISLESARRLRHRRHLSIAQPRAIYMAARFFEEVRRKSELRRADSATPSRRGGSTPPDAA